MTPNTCKSSPDSTNDITSLLGKTLAYDAAGRLSEATAIPPCPSGLNCSGAQTTLSRFNGWGQRFLRETPTAQSVFSYGTEGFNLLSETTRNLSTSALSTTEHIWLPTASGPMPVAAVIDGVHYAVHADHLNTPRRLTDASQAVKWQWPYSGFGEITPQSTPAAGQAPLNYGLRYPGQIDDGNGLFYNWHRFYDPRVGRYTSSDPIGLEGGWNRFGYVDANPLGFVDPEGLAAQPGDNSIYPPTHNCPCVERCKMQLHDREAYAFCAMPGTVATKYLGTNLADAGITLTCRKFFIEIKYKNDCAKSCAGKGPRHLLMHNK